MPTDDVPPIPTAADAAADTDADGMTLDLTTCEDEPIHIPGSIQPWAALLVADADGTVVSASDNLIAHLSIPATEAIGRSLAELTGATIEATPSDRLGASRTTRPLVTVAGSQGPINLSVHRHDDRILVEIEPSDGRQLAAETASVLAGLYATTDPEDLLEMACRMVADITGFDRVMAYRFEHDDHGVVVAETAAEGIETFLGLHYPASDIPAQARRLYLEHWLRLIPDVSYRPVPLQPSLDPAGRPIDLAAATSRSVSPIHIQYLVNMGVRASMSISLVVGGRLWGLLACHHYGGPRPVPAVQRALCELVGLTVSNLIGARLRAVEAERQARVDAALVRVLDSVTAATTLAEGLLGQPEALQRLCGADGMAVRVNGVISIRGSVPEPEVIEQLVERLVAREDVVLAVDTIDELVPAGGGWAGGMLAASLARVQGNYVLWFRDEWLRSVTWGGDPNKPVAPAEGTERLLPRSSFEAWTETVHRHCQPWTDVDRDAAGRLRSTIGTFLLARAEQLALLNSELARSNAELDSFAHIAAHDLKEPLRGVFNYVSFVEEDYGNLLDEAGRDQLGTIRRLVERMNALLETLLEYSRVGRAELDIHPVPLGELVDEAVELVQSRVVERSAEVVNRCSGEVLCDRPLLRTVLMNLLSNALKYNDGDRPRIEIDILALTDTEQGPTLVDPVSTAVDPAGLPVVVAVSDDGIGIAEDRREEVFEVFRRLHPRDRYGGGTGAGLTVARRIVERHGGRMWIETSPLGGTSVLFTVDQP